MLQGIMDLPRLHSSLGACLPCLLWSVLLGPLHRAWACLIQAGCSHQVGVAQSRMVQVLSTLWNDI